MKNQEEEIYEQSRLLDEYEYEEYQFAQINRIAIWKMVNANPPVPHANLSNSPKFWEKASPFCFESPTLNNNKFWGFA